MNNFFTSITEKLFNDQLLAKISHGLTEDEEKRCRNAIKEVISALKYCGFETRNYSHPVYSSNQEYKRMIYSPLQDKNNIQVAVFLQGSYASNTNVKGRSDVDIAVVDLSRFRANYEYDKNRNDYGFKKSTSSINIKNIILSGFIEYFGKEYVVRHDKCINIKSNSKRNNIDIVPAIQYRDYTNGYLKNSENYTEGTFIQTDKGKEIINYPFHHIKNSEKKHQETQKRYRKLVRIMKYLMYEMQKANIPEAKDISSFGVESLLFNIDNYYYTSRLNMKLGKHFQEILHILLQMLLSDTSHRWVEANGIKPLFKDYYMIQQYIYFIEMLNYYFESKGKWL